MAFPPLIFPRWQTLRIDGLGGADTLTSKLVAASAELVWEISVLRVVLEPCTVFVDVGLMKSNKQVFQKRFDLVKIVSVCFTIPNRKIGICLYFPLLFTILTINVWRCFTILHYLVFSISIVVYQENTSNKPTSTPENTQLCFTISQGKNLKEIPTSTCQRLSVGSHHNESASSVQGHHWSALGTLSCLLAKDGLWSAHT